MAAAVKDTEGNEEKEMMMKGGEGGVEERHGGNSNEDEGVEVKVLLPPSPPLSGVKMCTRCGVTRTPLWRNGPKGPKTLCNACGVRLNRQANKKNVQKRREAAANVTASTSSAQGWLASTKPKSLKRKREVTVKGRSAHATSYGCYADVAANTTASRSGRGRLTRAEKEKSASASDANMKKRRMNASKISRGGVKSNTMTKSSHRNQGRDHHPRDVLLARRQQCQRKRSVAVRSQHDAVFIRWAATPMMTHTVEAAAATHIHTHTHIDMVAVRLLRTATDRCVIERGAVKLPPGHVEDESGTILITADEMAKMEALTPMATMPSTTNGDDESKMKRTSIMKRTRIKVSDDLTLEFESEDACNACVQRLVAARDDTDGAPFSQQKKDRNAQRQQQQQQQQQQQDVTMAVAEEPKEKRESDVTDVIPIPSVRVVEDYDTMGSIGGNFEMPKDAYICCPTHDVLEKPGCANYELTDRDREWLTGLNDTMREFHEKLNSSFDQERDTECWRVITESQLERIFDVFDEGCASLGRRIDASMAAVLCQRREFGKPCPLVAAACFAWWEKRRGENERYLGGAFFRPPPDAEYRPDMRKSSLWTICAADVANGEIKRRKTKINSSLAAARRKVGKKRRRRKAGGGGTGRKPAAARAAAKTRHAHPSAPVGAATAATAIAEVATAAVEVHTAAMEHAADTVV